MSLTLWRISNYATLNGLGGLKYSARWHTASRPIVYLAESPAGAILETLVHIDTDGEEVPDTYTLLKAETSAAPSVEDLMLPPAFEWKQDELLTRSLGDRWLAGMQTALARVPSALVPETYNYLLNPLHPEAARLRITRIFEDPYDRRLLGSRG